MSCNYTEPADNNNRESQANEKEWTVEEVASMQGERVGETVSKTADGGAGVVLAGKPTAQPAVSLAAAVAKRPVSGRYKGTSGQLQLELRVDVDGKKPTIKISGDLYRTAGSVVTYFGSFIVRSPQITVGATEVKIKGTGDFSFHTSAPVVSVTIPRVAALAPAPSAKVTFSDSAGAVGSSFQCGFVSPYFRTVQYEQDTVKGTKAFSSYNTGSLPSGGPARTLSVVAAYAEAGIEMQLSGVSNIVSNIASGPDRKWSDAELHASMLQQFSLWRDQPQWKVWLLVATDHESQNLRGIMFDQQGKQRQGCAVFYDRIAGDEADAQRGALRTYVHELGHCFNLMHSWQKSFAVPPMPNRPDALSYMNYVQNFPGGAPAYWSAFPFQFDDPEVIHLRHAFRDNIIMGGNNFAVGAAEFDMQAFNQPLTDNSGLRLELEARKNFVMCEPVVIELKLYTTDMRGKRVHSNIHPNHGFTQLAIRKPGGQMVSYRPLVEQCVDPEFVVLDAERPSIYASAYVGYGKDGFYFDQAGFYQIIAVYHALDGSEVVSAPLTVRVRNPLNAEEEEIADHYYGDDQGTLFYLLGSDSSDLASGNKNFDEVLDKHAKHPLAVYARFVKGINAGRNFKTVTDDKTLSEREPCSEESKGLLTSAIDASMKGGGLDNITLNMATRRLARVQKRMGDDKGAKATVNAMLKYFTKMGLKPHVIKRIEEQVQRALAEEV